MRAISLSVEGVPKLMDVSDYNSLLSIRRHLKCEWIKPEEVTHSIFLWYSPEAALGAQPVMNIASMWLIQQLRGVFGLPIIWGDAIITGRDLRNLPLDLDPIRLDLVRNTLTAEV